MAWKFRIVFWNIFDVNIIQYPSHSVPLQKTINRLESHRHIDLVEKMLVSCKAQLCQLETCQYWILFWRDWWQYYAVLLVCKFFRHHTNQRKSHWSPFPDKPSSRDGKSSGVGDQAFQSWSGQKNATNTGLSAGYPQFQWIITIFHFIFPIKNG